MSDPWIGIVSTLIGAATGVVSSAITMTIQARQTNRTALKKLAIELALEDYRFRVNDKTGRVEATPVSESKGRFNSPRTPNRKGCRRPRNRNGPRPPA